MVFGIVYLVGGAVVGLNSLFALKCDGDHDDHVCLTVRQRVVGTAVLVVGWPVMIPLFVAHKLRGRR